MAAPDRLPILIIGAGVSGLALAQYFHKTNIPFRIFDRDPSLSARTEGWGLTLHWALPALQELLPGEIWSRLGEVSVNKEAARKGDPGQFQFFNLKTGVAKYEVPVVSNARIRVLRTKFRHLLATDINIEVGQADFMSVDILTPTLQWSKRLVDIEDREDRVVAYFEDGSSCQGRLLVACDGSNSCARRYLYPSNYENQPIPVRFLGATVRYSPGQIAAARGLDPYFFQGTHSESNVYLFFSCKVSLQVLHPVIYVSCRLSDSNAILVLDCPFNFDDSTSDYVVQIVVSWAEGKGIDIPPGRAERIALLKQLTQDWDEKFRALVHNIPDDTEVTAMDMRDWLPPAKCDHGRIVLMGDAAHTMTMCKYNPGGRCFVVCC
jgi:2-polyprenyl-6-methoxyphenol hydroxylase-like FAD-dependent oxidoreductase